jgi:hypothetical protein
MKITFRKIQNSGAELDDYNGSKVVCAAISAVCFALLLAAFVLTEETKFIQGKSIFCHSFCLMITFMCLFANFMQFVTSGSTLCYITGDIVTALIFTYGKLYWMFSGYLTHYTCMSAFFWLNVICFDVFWTFW